MKETKEIIVTPSILRRMLCHGDVYGIGEDMIIASRHEASDYDQLGYPFRIDSYLAAFCFHGRLNVSIDLNEYELSEGMLLIGTPGKIIRLTGAGGNSEKIDGKFTVINVSESFFKSIGVDMSKIIIDATQVLQNPCIRLNGREITLLSKYVDIVIDILDSGSRHYIAESISSVVASVFYQFAGFIHNTMSNQCSAGKSPSTRQRKLFEQFMRLAAENHRYERQMAFYADKLCITPKYLSKIVRDQSGKSGPQWIDDLVILSAENMLKNSDIPIKEISSYLNFPSQSLFFRFFKKQTGRTPSQYRQS